MDRIEITGVRAFGYHGVFEHEQAEGQHFVVDVALHADLSAAAATDDLKATVDYGTLGQRVAEVVATTRFDLIEALAQRICDLVLEDPRVAEVEVRVAKPDAPMPVEFDEVAVVLRRTRGGA